MKSVRMMGFGNSYKITFSNSSRNTFRSIKQGYDTKKNVALQEKLQEIIIEKPKTNEKAGIVIEKGIPLSPGINDDLEEYKESLDGISSSEKNHLEYKCKVCKNTVFREWNIVRHTVNYENCQSYFIDNVDWMKEMDEKETTLYCPNKKCSVMVGKIVVSGVKCTCGKWIKPANQVMKNYVERNKIKN